MQRLEFKKEFKFSATSTKALDSVSPSSETYDAETGANVGSYLEAQRSLSDAEERDPIFGPVDGRLVIISWGLRERSTFEGRAPWEPQFKSSPSWFNSDEKQLYDLRIAISLQDARLFQLMGLTTVNILETFDGFDGSIWADQHSFQTALFSGEETAGDPAGLGAALEIADGFRVTLRDGMCILDSLGPADSYGSDDMKRAVDYVAKLETNLISMIEAAFEPDCSVPNPIIAHLAMGSESAGATDALRRLVFEHEEGQETGPALRSLLKRKPAASLQRELLDLFSRASLSRELADIVLEGGDFDEASLIKLLDACPLDAMTLSVQEAAILARLLTMGGALALQTIGARLSRRASPDVTNSWERGHEKARLALIARHGDDHTRELSLAEGLSDESGLSLPDTPLDSLDRLDALRPHKERHATLMERTVPRTDDSLE